MKTDPLDQDSGGKMTLPVVKFRQGEDGKYLGVGEGIEALVGLTEKEIMQEVGAFQESLVEGDRSRREVYQGKVRSGDQDGEPCRFRLRHQQSGMIHDILEWGILVENRRGKGLEKIYEGIWLDMSLVSRLQHRLGESLWQQNLVGLTGGLVHDLNNVLAGIGSLIELGLMDMAKDHPLRSMMNQLKENTFKATGLTQHLTRLLHCKSGVETLMDLNTLVGETEELLRRAVPRNIELVKTLAEEPIPVRGGHHELQQLLISLVYNAQHSIAGKGRIEILTGSYEGLPEHAREVAGEGVPSEGVFLTVRDNGSGIMANRLSGVIELDYSTKPQRFGIGLGLFYARKVCLELGGAMSVEAGPGEGTLVHIWLPRAEFTEERRREKVKILVTGDLEVVSGSLEEALRGAGLEVLKVPESEVFRVAFSGWETYGGMILGLSTRSLNECPVYALWQAYRQFKLPIRLVLITEPGRVKDEINDHDQVALVLSGEEDVTGMSRRILELFEE